MYNFKIYFNNATLYVIITIIIIIIGVKKISFILIDLNVINFLPIILYVQCIILGGQGVRNMWQEY